MSSKRNRKLEVGLRTDSLLTWFSELILILICDFFPKSKQNMCTTVFSWTRLCHQFLLDTHTMRCLLGDSSPSLSASSLSFLILQIQADTTSIREQRLAIPKTTMKRINTTSDTINFTLTWKLMQSPSRGKLIELQPCVISVRYISSRHFSHTKVHREIRDLNSQRNRKHGCLLWSIIVTALNLNKK